MKSVVQRVSEARCSVEGRTTGSIQTGLVVFLGIERGDSPEDRTSLLGSILGLRVFENETGKLDRSLRAVGGGLLVIPNFTLCARMDGGRRPSFEDAASPDRARTHWENFIQGARERHSPVEQGKFGATMEVQVKNDGPVTLMLGEGPSDSEARG